MTFLMRCVMVSDRSHIMGPRSWHVLWDPDQTKYYKNLRVFVTVGTSLLIKSFNDHDLQIILL